MLSVVRCVEPLEKHAQVREISNLVNIPAHLVPLSVVNQCSRYLGDVVLGERSVGELLVVDEYEPSAGPVSQALEPRLELAAQWAVL